MNTDTAKKFEATEWLVVNRSTGRHALIAASTWQDAAFIAMRLFELRTLDDLEITPHEAATSR